MRLILTALVFLAGLFDLMIAATFLFDPQSGGAQLGVGALGALGTSTIRADFTSFFAIAAFCMMWGAWRRNADLLLVPALLFGASFTGRVIDLLISGPYPGFSAPMLIEAGHVVLMLAAWRMLPHHTVHEVIDEINNG
ncbi:hypothetical protein RXV95_02875 [Novosphingobium sp. ZN18A2]|uniref:hypothetical protein n=1 Tax=Novosphingobium sp. ZN18A2 TaxID=3079861 RepID=UPI0030CD8731